MVDVFEFVVPAVAVDSDNNEAWSTEFPLVTFSVAGGDKVIFNADSSSFDALCWISESVTVAGSVVAVGGVFDSLPKNVW